MPSIDEVVRAITPYLTIGGLVYIGGRLHLLSHLDRQMLKVKGNVKVIADALIKAKLKGFDHQRIQSYSPLKVTDIGEKFLKETGFIKMFMEHKNDFFECIKEDDPKTDYDIENSSYRSVFFLFDKPYFSDVKNYLYQNPKEDRDSFMQVAGLYIRDKYMENIKEQKGKEACILG